MTELKTAAERLASIEAKVDILLEDRQDAKQVAKSQWYHSGVLTMILGYISFKTGIIPH